MVINIDVTMAIVMSAVVALIYTVFGQVVSVAYTDVIQLIFITVGLVSILRHAHANTCTCKHTL